MGGWYAAGYGNAPAEPSLRHLQPSHVSPPRVAVYFLAPSFCRCSFIFDLSLSHTHTRTIHTHITWSLCLCFLLYCPPYTPPFVSVAHCRYLSLSPVAVNAVAVLFKKKKN